MVSNGCPDLFSLCKADSTKPTNSNQAAGQDDGEGIFHEKQRSAQCAIHTLNNLYQEHWISRQMMDELADITFQEYKELCRKSSLRPPMFNRYKNFWGNYDINVIVRALQIRQAKFQKHLVMNKKRTNLEEIQGNLDHIDYASPDLIGFIVNVQASPFPIKHWYAVARVNGVFYNLNSNLQEPQIIGSEKVDVQQWLEAVIRQPGTHVFMIEGKAAANPLSEASSHIKKKSLECSIFKF